MSSIFVSHAHSDWRLAKRVQHLLESASGNGFDIKRSSEEGAIKSGENWRDWIDERIMSCDVAIVLLTPASFRGKWVLWEAGAATGVQYERLKGADLTASDPLLRRVRVLKFGVDTSELGPFASAQTRDGLTQADIVAFVSEMLEEYRDQLSNEAIRKGMLKLEKTAAEFIEGARQDLRYTPIHASEDIVQEWLARLDEASKREDYRWIIASKRWINVSFLGAENADAHLTDDPQAVDFRIHMRIARAHGRLGEWSGAIEQLELAASMSPNDLVVLRELGRAYRAIKDVPQLEKVMERMKQLDPQIFAKDREGVALRCAYHAELNQWDKVDEVLTNADLGLIATDAYLANWHAIARMKSKGPEASRLLFKQLKELLSKTGKGFWDDATLVNALLALDEQDESRKRLQSLDLNSRSRDEVESASRFYDEIITSFGHKFDWRAAAGISSPAA